jgi:hypothetical protein
MAEPTMGVMARWTFYQRFIAEHVRDTDPRHVEAWMRVATPRRSMASHVGAAWIECEARTGDRASTACYDRRDGTPIVPEGCARPP